MVDVIPILAENHRRVITTMLWMLDEMLTVFERWCTTAEIHSILYEEKNSLTTTQQQGILQEAADLRQLLKLMQEQLQLTPHTHDITRAISVRSTLFATDALHALTAKELGKYGAISTELETYLKPKLDELVQHVNTIAKIAEEK